MYLSICVIGFTSIWTFEVDSLKTNFAVGWSLRDEGPFPFLSQNLTLDDSGWYTIPTLAVNETCLEGDCVPLYYNLKVSTLNGFVNTVCPSLTGECSSAIYSGGAEVIN